MLYIFFQEHLRCSKLAQREHTTVQGTLSIRNCARDWNLTILPNGICTKRNPSWRMKRIKFSGVLREKNVPNPGQKTRPRDKKERTRICCIVDFSVLVDHSQKIKESEKIKYLDIARELKKLWNMKVMVIPIITDALGTFTKSLEWELKELEIRGRIETTQITEWFRSARILRRVLEIRRDFLSLKLQWKTIS